MATPPKFPPHIPEDTPLICHEPIVIDKSSQRTVNVPYGNLTINDDDEVQILGEKRGELLRRRSRRIVGEFLNQSEKRKREESKKKAKEQRTKRKHDVNVIESSDELLSKWIQKENQGEDGSIKSTPQQKEAAPSKKRSSTRGVDPSAKKQQEKKRKSVKKGKQPKDPASSDSSESEGETLPHMPSELIEGKKVIGGEILDKGWILKNGLNDLFEMIKEQGWDKLFCKSNSIYQNACREFYKNLVVKIINRKEVVVSRVRGVDISALMG
ncbi:hypothetical protein Dimus_036984 [Dionaea muscipula]